MKKFTFMLIAAFMAVVSWAGLSSDKMVKKAPMQLAGQVTTSAKQVTPTKKAATVKLQAPASNRMAAKAKAGARKAPKKAGIADWTAGEWMLCSDYYEYDAEAEGLVEATPAAGGTPIVFSEIDEQTIGIEGFTSDAEEVILATYAATTDEELLAAGVVAELSIADGQTLLESSYGPVLLVNVSAEEEGTPITAYVLADGSVVINAIWADILGGDGQYAGYLWSGYYYNSAVLPVNGTMTWTKDETANEVPVVIEQDPENIKNVTVYNFADEATAVVVTMKADNKFAINSQLVYDGGSTYGQFYTYATDGESVSATITGTGTEDALTFDGSWTLYAPSTGYWYGLLDAATIAYTDGSQFEYPVIPDVAATPANPDIVELGNYDSSKEYGYILFDVPTTDVDGNDLRESKLFYQLYSDIDGDIQPIVFTPDLYEKIEEDMSIIPFNFTDGYDFDEYDGSKLVYLNFDFNTMYDRIGVRSIYTGGGETNVSETVWVEVEKPEPLGGDFTFDFNTMDVPTSSNVTTDGDITEALTLTEGDVALTISPKDESASTANRFWGTNAGPQLRVYSGTLTFEAPEGMNITQIVFNAAKWNDGNSADSGEFDGTIWTGKAQTVVVSIAGNSQINSIVVTVEGEGGEPIEPAEAIDPDGLTYDFEDGTPQGWTTIDADGDGYVWENTQGQVSAYKGSLGAMKSESYINEVGALTPDNYLVSPKFKLGAPIKFFACAQDASYPAEHFAVCVSTKGNKDAADFEVVQEWTLTAARADKFRAPRKVQGNWYEYAVDLSEYEGQEGYVAIRHFDVTDQFYMLVDDISFGKSAFEITPAEGIVESLDEFEITFNKFEVTAGESGIAATLVNLDTEETWITNEVKLENNILTFDMSEDGEITAPGIYALTVSGVMNGEEELELIFAYTIKEPLVLVELPEGVEAQEYTLEAVGSDSQSTLSTANTKLVAFDGTDVYLQGLAYYFPEAFVKGTLTEEGQVLVPSGQYVGTDKYGDEFLVALDVDEENTLIDAASGVIAFDYDAESGVLSLVEDTYFGESGTKDAEDLYNYFYSAIYTPGAFVLPDVVELPEGAEASTWYLAAYDSDDAFVNREVGVAIVDNDIYVQGICDYLPESWVKGTIDAEAGTATFANGQFYGTYSDTYNLFFLGYGEEMGEDVVFTYDAENGVLTTENSIVLAGDQRGNQMFDYYYDVEITRDRPDSFPVEAPEDLVTETYSFTANVVTAGEDDDTSFARKAEAEAEVTIDFNAMDVATSSNDSTDGDITEALTLTEGGVTLTISPADEHYTNAANRFWGTTDGPQLRVYSGTLTVEAPEGSNMTQIVFNHNGKWGDTNSADSGELTNDAEAKAATWTGEAQKVVFTIGKYDESTDKYTSGNSQINDIVVTLKGESGEEPDPEEPVVEKNYSYQIEVGFDGNDVYFSGINSDCADYWMKGTLSEDGKTVTIPASQYMGGFSFWGFTFDYFITAMDEEGNMADIVLNYDAEKATFTTAQTVVLNGAKFDWDPYQTFTDVEITKMQDFAATPADPIFEAYDFEQNAGFNKIYASIPTVDVDGNELLTSNLFYTIWIEKDGKEQPYVFTAELYSFDFEEDVTEVPYSHNGYDIYSGGEIIYLEDDPAELATWTKVGIQSIYYGGGERNASNIVWAENSEHEDPVGIADVKTDSKNVVVFDLQGRRVAKTAKGLYIMDGKKVVIK
ncbi:MAG: choice-of-anchor J domain-containing protein [Prevotella sp.]|nr:choice-of-anchor J domain-containing protein [Prevotella sp.]